MTVHDNFTGRTIRDSLTGNPNTHEQPGEATRPAELISQSVLIRLTEKVWINPQHVVSVEFYAKDGMTAEDDPRIIVSTTSGNHVVRNTTLGVIVALINGDAL